MYRSTYIEINNKNLLENVKEIKKEYNNYKYYRRYRQTIIHHKL